MKRFKKTVAAVLLLICSAVLLALSAACANSTIKTITYDTGTETVKIQPLKAKAGSKIYPPADPERGGYRFECWTLDGEPFTFNVMPDRDVTLKAKWNKLYSLNFITDTGTVSSAEYSEGETIAFPQPPTRDGYKFSGWYSGGDPFTSDVMPAKNLNLTAKWEQAYTIKFDTGTSSFTVSPIVETVGAEISAPVVRRPNYYLKGWKLGNTMYEFTTMPAQNITLTAVWLELTNLPSMFIELSDKSGNTYPLGNVNKENYVDSKITITNAEKEEYEFANIKSNFKGRGNGSWGEAKKGYKLKFDKKQSLFGREANKHWVIIACTNFDDVTMSRNYLAYNMGNEVFDNIEYSTQAKWIDVYVNGNYQGVYLLCEHVRVGKGRIDIESDYLTENFENTGYLVEYDAYFRDNGAREGIDYFTLPGVNLKYGFTVHSPDPEDCNDDTEGGKGELHYRNQVKYIQDYIKQVYQAAVSGNYAKFEELADVDSFVDMYILHELFKNVDTGYSSFYLYKKPNGKLYAGPPWDFDATANSAYDRGDRTPTGLYVADQVQWGSSHCASELYISLYKTTGFQSAIRARWKVLSPKIKQSLDERLNDQVYADYKTAMGKNFAKWKYKSQAQAEADWVNDMKALKKWLTDRITWLDSTWK